MMMIGVGGLVQSAGGDLLTYVTILRIAKLSNITYVKRQKGRISDKYRYDCDIE